MRTLIIGNSGSGKSTLARQLTGGAADVRILDLDTIAWLPGPEIRRRPAGDLRGRLEGFCTQNAAWIIEGCYGDLAEVVLEQGPELIFLNPPMDTCLRHCAQRPWEPHKYASKEAQDANLAFLLEWVRAYYTRDDECSLRRHRAIFELYPGPKRELAAPVHE